MKKKPEFHTLGQRIRATRLKKGFSQEGFAYAVGFDRSYYGRVERGQINISARNLIRIAKTLGVQVGDLFPPI